LRLYILIPENNRRNISINEQSPLILSELTEHKKIKTCDVENAGPGLEQAQNTIEKSQKEAKSLPLTHRYMTTHWGIVTKPVPSQENDWSCICVLGVSLPSLYQARKVIGWYRLGNDTPNTQIHDHSLSWLGTGLVTIPLTHRYMTNQFPDWSCICVLRVSLPSLYQARKVIGHVSVC
jgi:hypothetical protein